tara:strand:+ start:111 stop:230 length:120 start_codon:yes stop_codon:yes gene_type:complete
MNWEMIVGIIWIIITIWALYEGITSPIYDDENEEQHYDI